MHIITGLGTGGAEAMLYKLLTKSCKPSEQVVVSLSQGGKHRELLQKLGVQVLELNLKQIWMFPVRFIQVLQLIRKKNIQVINAWMYHAALFASLLKLLSFGISIRLLWNIRHSLHDLKQEKTSLRIVIRLLKYMVRFSDGIIFNSRKSATEHGVYWDMQDKVHFVANGFELEKWLPKSKVDSNHANLLRDLCGIKSSETRLIGHVGRAHPMKNHQGLIKAFLSVADKHPDVDLVLIGKGTQELDIGSDAAANRIHLLGERNDVQALMPCLDYFVLGSNWGEGFPNVLGEAMACELPSMTTDVGDSAYLLDNHEWVVPPYDELALAAKLDELLSLDDDAQGRLGKLYRERIETHFSIASIADIYDALYVGADLAAGSHVNSKSGAGADTQ
ncbi:glycosyltransferase [Paraneptunicella aestuarii]|uniref:glycosyltransferase n=1 Tax=Paraneptunicella aestuarii TaxID=2831148 RepID=UPI001E56187B|nr:glycosyltransferase [Paraneptunicella aestuarii]UAA39684.1 glycosyltransferase [Paraneptunicella aestuarii]